MISKDSHTQCEGHRPLDAYWAGMLLQKKKKIKLTRLGIEPQTFHCPGEYATITPP